MAETEEEEASLAFQLLSDGWVGVVEERGKVGSHLLDGLSGCGIELMHRVTAKWFELFDLLLSIFSKDGGRKQASSAVRLAALGLCAQTYRGSDLPYLQETKLLDAIKPYLKPPTTVVATRILADGGDTDDAFASAARQMSWHIFEQLVAVAFLNGGGTECAVCATQDG